MNYDRILEVMENYSADYPNLRLIASVKSGKEAEVYLVEFREKLLALKIFKENTKFSSRQEYIDFDNMKFRERKAIVQRSNVGRNMTENLWTSKEYSGMKKLYDNGASVPKPYGKTTNSLLMEYIGDADYVAPRLIDVNLNSFEVQKVFDEIIYNLEIFLHLGIVHGDLSPYNILYWNKRIFIIDFPQILNLNHQNGRQKFKVDINNMVNYFEKYLGQRDISYLNSFLRRF